MSPTFLSLGVRNYRLWFLGAIVSNIGTWAGRVAQDWLVLVDLTDRDATALGVVTGLQFLPMLLLAPWAGLVADRFSKRRVLAITQTGMLLTSVLLGVLALLGWATLAHVFVIAFVQGCFAAVDAPARQAFASELVPMTLISNAVSLNSASFHLGRLVGPALAGLVIAAFGTPAALLGNSATFVAILFALALMRPSELTRGAGAKGRGAIREGIRYVRGRKDLQLLLFFVFMLGTFGLNFQLTTALMATTVYGKGPREFGLLGTAIALGALAGSLLSARRAEPRLRVILVGLAGFVVASLAASLAPTYATFAVLLVPCGLAALTVMTTANALVQVRVDPLMRGRVMALYMAIFMGGTPFGAPLIGWIGGHFGARWTILIGSVAIAVALVVAAIGLAREENVRVSFESQRRPRLRVGIGPATPDLRDEVTEPEPEATR